MKVSIVISNCVSSISVLEYLILEQVCIAALDCNRIDIANYCIKQLVNEFPKSHRVQKYIAMRLEAQGRYEEALQKYEKLIKEDETNSAARKRKITILKAQGKTIEAIKELTDYLKMYVTKFITHIVLILNFQNRMQIYD